MRRQNKGRAPRGGRTMLHFPARFPVSQREESCQFPASMARKAKSAAPTPPPFLVDLLNARSPSGYEFEAQAVWDRHVTPRADATVRDAMGNRISTLNPGGDPVLMLAGHIDELGLQIIGADKEGFLRFRTIGGHDRVLIPGRRVVIRTTNGNVLGVTGKRAVHQMDTNDRKHVPEVHEMWIDIGATTRKEALTRVAVGDAGTYDHGFAMLHGPLATARGLDNKAGAFVVGEVLIRLAQDRKRLAAQIVAAGTVQEEVGERGAKAATYGINPHIAIGVDVTHATDHPDCDHRKMPDLKLGGGPAICRGPNINPWVCERLVQCAERAKIPVQFEAEPRSSGTDVNSIQVGRAGVATGLVSIPLRYMHTPSEVADLRDIEQCVQLLVEFAQSLSAGEHGHW